MSNRIALYFYEKTAAVAGRYFAKTVNLECTERTKNGKIYRMAMKNHG